MVEFTEKEITEHKISQIESEIRESSYELEEIHQEYMKCCDRLRELNREKTRLQMAAEKENAK